MKVKIIKVRRLIPLFEGFGDYKVYYEFYETGNGIKRSINIYKSTLSNERYLMNKIMSDIKEYMTSYKELAKKLEGKILEREVS